MLFNKLRIARDVEQYGAMGLKFEIKAITKAQQLYKRLLDLGYFENVMK